MYWERFTTFLPRDEILSLLVLGKLPVMTPFSILVCDRLNPVSGTPLVPLHFPSLLGMRLTLSLRMRLGLSSGLGLGLYLTVDVCTR